MSTQRTHELVARTESRGEFVIFSGDEATVGQVQCDLREYLDTLDRTKGHILVRLPAQEVLELIGRDIVPRA